MGTPHWYATFAGQSLHQHQDIRSAPMPILMGLGPVDPVWLESSHLWIGEHLLACATRQEEGVLHLDALYVQNANGEPCQIAGSRDKLMEGAKVLDITGAFSEGRRFAQAIQARVFSALSLQELETHSLALERWQDSVLQTIWLASAAWPLSVRLAQDLWACHPDLPEELRRRELTASAKKPSGTAFAVEWNLEGYPGVLFVPAEVPVFKKRG